MPLLQIFFMGVMLGLGAAVPIGPINLEIIRRNLSHNLKTGLIFGFGACSADLVYLILLSYGALSLLTEPILLKIIAGIGALILMYFAYGAFTAKPADITQSISSPYSLSKQYLSGLLLTLTNPMTILFWASISSQVAALAIAHPHAIFYAGFGVIIGTVGWVIILNTFIHVTKHKISNHIINMLNKIGGVLLLAFAVFSIYYSVL